MVTLVPDDYWSGSAIPANAQEQASEPDAPFRRQPENGGKVWGVAYHVIPSKAREVDEYLNFREKNGYTTDRVLFYPSEGAPAFSALIYIGTPKNPQFLGPQDPEHLAQTIATNHGPSGSNLEYLLNLQTSLKELSSHSMDQHVEDLVSRVRQIGR